MSRLALKCVAFTPFALVAACGGNPDAATIAALSGDSANGKTLYENNCQVCHGPNGKTGTANKDIVHEAKDETTEAISTILDGDGTMPSWRAQLTNQQVADIIAYLKTL
jgi:cytochrome c6